MITNLDSIINIVGRTFMSHNLKSMKIFTLIMNKIFI
jgi:hypothetical protein